jgi:hypothetical protein
MSVHELSDGKIKSTRPVQIEKEKPCTLIIAPSDDYAVIIGGRQSLHVYVVDLRDGLGKPVKLKLEKPKEYAFKEGDAASIIGHNTLLISYHKGMSVTVDLTYALDDMNEESGK